MLEVMVQKSTKALRSITLALAAACVLPTGMAIAATTPPADQPLSPDAIKAQSQALSGAIVAQIKALAAAATPPTSEDYESAVVQVIVQNSTDQAVQIAALEQSIATRGLSNDAYAALRRILVAARAGRLKGTAALGSGFAPSSPFSAPTINLGGGSTNYRNP
jgi:hypothetical protein